MGRTVLAAVLEEIAAKLIVDDLGDQAYVTGTIRALRRRFGVKRPPDEVRARTRERVRRHCQRCKALAKQGGMARRKIYK